MKSFRWIAAAASAFSILVLPGTLQAGSSPWDADYFSNRPVVDQNGRTLRFYDDLIKDKIVVVSFIYTNCPDLCPLTTARLAQVRHVLGDAVGRDIFFLSLTVDPERDTPERLKSFSDAFDVGPGWTFVTGKPEDMKAINHALGDRSRTLSEHRNEVVLGNDRTGEWARDSTFGDLDRLILDIRAMNPEWRAQTNELTSGVSLSQEAVVGVVSQQPGQALFKKICSSCHSFGVGDLVGPDLMGVTERRDLDWLTRYIMDPAKVRAESDPIAQELHEQFPGVKMPALGLSETDAADLIDYLRQQSELIAEARRAGQAEHHNHDAAPDHHAMADHGHAGMEMSDGMK